MLRIVWGLLGMSLEASIVVWAVLFLRQLFRRLPKSYSCVLWMFVLIRLLCPAAISSSLSLMPDSGILRESDAGQSAEYGGTAFHTAQAGQWNQNAGAQNVADAGNSAVQQNADADRGSAANRDSAGTKPTAAKTISERLESLVRQAAGKAAAFWASYGIWVSLVWLAGAVWLTVAYLVQYMGWREKVRGCAGTALGGEGIGPACEKCLPEQKLPYGGRIRQRKISLAESGRISEPFVSGIINPVIYLPAGMEEKERGFILSHELMHVRHGDPFLRLLWQAALVLHWFNPFVWLAVSLVQKDMEMFCDESVMRQYGKGARKEYAMTLLHFSAKKSGLPFPVAFGESNTESRIQHILKVKKPALAASVAAAAVIALAAIVLLTDPESPENSGNAAAGQESEAEGNGQNGTEQGAVNGASDDHEEAQALSRNEKIFALAERWAKAASNRDGNQLVEMLADPSGMDDYKLDDGSYFYGFSSPWPWMENYRISYAYDRDEVIIHYYANTSDPSILPWREVLTLTREDGDYLVDGWETDMEAITSKAEFSERFHYEDPAEYGGDSGYGYRFRNTPMDMFYPVYETEEGTDMFNGGPGREETWAYWLIRHENEPYMIDAWQTPEKGAAAHLYLDGGHAVEVESPWEDKVCLRWEFEDGLTDVICMCHPSAYMEDGTYRESDFWVVENILEETDYERGLKKSALRSYYEEHPDRLEADSVSADRMPEAMAKAGAVVKISETPDHSAVMYGLVTDRWTEGVLLLTGNDCQYFDWSYTGSHMVLPDMMKADYDGDGQEELAVSLHVYTGTGISREQLFMLERQPDGSWDAEENTQYLEQIEAEVTCTYQEEDKLLAVNDGSRDRLIGEMDVSELTADTDVYTETRFGDIVSFVFEKDEIYVQLEPGIRMNEEWVLRYTGEDALRAQIAYDGRNFSVRNYEMIKP